jgi:hypothetical protein
VKRFAATHDRVLTVAEPKQGGMGWDMRSGFDTAHGSWMVAIEGDAQHPVEDVLRMYREMRLRRARLRAASARRSTPGGCETGW